MWLTDLNSRNGTFVNGERIGEPQLLKVDDEVEVGDTRFKVEQANPADVFEKEKINVTLTHPITRPKDAAYASISTPEVSEGEQAIPPQSKEFFARLVRRWWMVSAGLLSVLGLVVMDLHH